MGKFEKLVVLVVLFLVTLILVVSLNTDDPESLAHAGIGRIEAEVTTYAPVDPEAVPDPMLDPVNMDWMVVDPEETESAVFDPSSALLSTRVESETTSGPAGVQLPEGSILLTSVSLTETLLPDLFLHTWQEGDTYESLTALYYGDPACVDLLLRVNDDRVDVPIGDTVFIPAFDVRERPRNRRRRVVDLQPIGGGVIYRTLEGDSLWKISKKHYGNGSSWNVIYEANLEVLKSPDSVLPGMELRIP